MLIVHKFKSKYELVWFVNVVAPKGRLLSRNPSVERTFSLPSNASAPGTFLLPSYPLATRAGGMPTPTVSRHRVDSSLSMSNTWPNKRDNGPQQQGTSPRREREDPAKGNLVKELLCVKWKVLFLGGFLLVKLYFFGLPV